MAILGRLRFSMAAIMMLVVAAAAESALFAKVRALLVAKSNDSWVADAPALLLLGITLTALAIAAARRHTVVQAMLQITLACLALLPLLYLGEASSEPWAERAIRYWFQLWFALAVVLPLAAWRLVAGEMEPGPRLDWWRKTFESVVASFANVSLVAIGAMLQFVAAELIDGIF